MKENFEKAEMEIIEFETEDVITASVPGPTFPDGSPMPTDPNGLPIIPW